MTQRAISKQHNWPPRLPRCALTDTQPQKSVAEAERCFTFWRSDARCLGTWTPPASVTCERDHMRSFRLTMLVTGVALSVSLASFAGHPVLADSVESVPVETGKGDSVCRSDDIGSEHEPSAMSEGVCPEHATEPDETARARAYLIETATISSRGVGFDFREICQHAALCYHAVFESCDSDGRGLWTSSGDRTPWLQEGGKGMRLMAVQSRSIPIRSPSNGSPDRDGLRPQTARLIWCITARSAAGGFRFHCPPTHQQ